jgi:acetoin utilization deacetylase AcuC-like enzyme
MTIKIISHPDCLLHEKLLHPECPARLSVIADELIRSGLAPLLQHELAPLATREELLRVHDSQYIDSIFKLALANQAIDLDEDTYMNPYSLNAALRAAGSVVYAVNCAMSSKPYTAFCNVRPPGHHAERGQAMGFCIFNNVAVGVAHALNYYQLQRVAIAEILSSNLKINGNRLAIITNGGGAAVMAADRAAEVNVAQSHGYSSLSRTFSPLRAITQWR